MIRRLLFGAGAAYLARRFFNNRRSGGGYPRQGLGSSLLRGRRW